MFVLGSSSSAKPLSERELEKLSLLPGRRGTWNVQVQSHQFRGVGCREEREGAVRDVQVEAILSYPAEGSGRRAVQTVGGSQQDLRGGSIRGDLQQSVERVGRAVDGAIDIESEVVSPHRRRQMGVDAR
jgi:hypothetical protein